MSINEDAVNLVCDAAEEIAHGDVELTEAITIVRELVQHRPQWLSDGP